MFFVKFFIDNGVVRYLIIVTGPYPLSIQEALPYPVDQENPIKDPLVKKQPGVIYDMLYT